MRYKRTAVRIGPQFLRWFQVERKKQCNSRWCDVLHPSIALTAGRTGEWSEDEDIKLQDAVQTHDDKDWAAISSLVPGRTKMQCSGRWNDFLDPFIDQANGRKGKWTVVEDSKLKNAVQTHGCKDWAAISSMVPGRTKKQCKTRWHNVLASAERMHER
jgi:myb proto-oncogene protein